MNVQIDLYAADANDILSVLLTDETAWQTAYINHGLRSTHMPTMKHFKAYEAIVNLRKEGKPIKDTFILEACGSVVALEDIGKWINAADPLLKAAFAETVKRVKERGQTRITKAILNNAAQQIEQGKSRKQVSAEVIGSLASIDANADVQNETAHALSDELDDLFNAPPERPLWTGLHWFDALAGGIGRKRYWGIVAPYKSRKTTTALNLTIGTIMRAYGCGEKIPSIGFFSGEMLAPEIGYWIIAMLAVGYLTKLGLRDEAIPGKFFPDNKPIPHGYITGELLYKSGNGYKGLGIQRAQAIDYARQTFRDVFKNNLRLYDKTKERGCLRDFEAVKNAFLRDKLLYDTELAVVDYLQIFSTGNLNDSQFHRSEHGATLFLDLTKTESTSFVVLAQQNEEGVKHGSGTSPQVAGGGALPKCVEYLVENHYMRDNLTSSQLRWNMKLARYTGTGEQIVNIHPPSGLVLDNSWVEKIRL